MALFGVLLATLIQAIVLTRGIPLGTEPQMTILELGSCPWVNDPWFTVVTNKVAIFNRTTAEFEGQIDLSVDAPEDTKVNLKMYHKDGDEWEDNVLPEQDTNFCDLIKEDDNYWPAVQRTMDLPKFCPIPKKVYKSVENEPLVLKTAPASQPPGCHRLDISFLNNEKEVGCIYTILWVYIDSEDSDPPDDCKI